MCLWRCLHLYSVHLCVGVYAYVCVYSFVCSWMCKSCFQFFPFSFFSRFSIFGFWFLVFGFLKYLFNSIQTYLFAVNRFVDSFDWYYLVCRCQWHSNYQHSRCPSYYHVGVAGVRAHRALGHDCSVRWAHWVRPPRRHQPMNQFGFFVHWSFGCCTVRALRPENWMAPGPGHRPIRPWKSRPRPYLRILESLRHSWSSAPLAARFANPPFYFVGVFDLVIIQCSLSMFHFRAGRHDWRGKRQTEEQRNTNYSFC